jgi:uncharacterized protein with NAD-binding domain and iron-sulfur cluster
MRIAIVGGGSSGVAAAFWLSSTPQLRQRYQVSLWTRGWRLGGKGASGRDAEAGQRIEEHGLHLWLGFYNNAFTTMRAAFAAAPDTVGTFKSVEDAFTPVRTAVFMQRDEIGGPYSPWPVTFPPLDGQPGDFLPKPDPFAALIAWLKMVVGPKLPLNVARSWNERLAPAERLAVKSRKAAAVRSLQSESADVEEARKGVGQAMFDVEAARTTQAAGTGMRFLILANLGLAALDGYLRDLFPYGFSRAAYDALDALEFREWLKSHHAWEESLACGPLQAIYDLAFAYPGGDAQPPSKGAMAAGVTLRLVESLGFGYRDAPVFRMKAGMGDTIFTPLYDALVAQGVEINFFHALADVAPSQDGLSIQKLTLRRQADLLSAPYRPFVTVKGLRCWPSQPDWAQLRNGTQLEAAHVEFELTSDLTSAGTVELNAGQEFDAVVLALPPDSLKLTTPSLRANASWADMLDNSATTATLAAQFWLKTTSAETGFCVQPPPPLSGYAENLSTWADMSHLLPVEDWPSPSPQSIHYFCGTMMDPQLGSDPVGVAKTQTLDWMRDNIPGLWPAAPRDGDIDDQIVRAYFRANLDPSERYTQAPPGNIAHRLAPDSKPFDNLYLAGDWTRLPVSGGCIETAMQSGMVVARAISQADIPIDDHC